MINIKKILCGAVLICLAATISSCSQNGADGSDNQNVTGETKETVDDAGTEEAETSGTVVYPDEEKMIFLTPWSRMARHSVIVEPRLLS